MGWRYFLFSMGGLMILLWLIRFVVFTLHESPKYLMGCGRDQEAVEVMHKLAKYNGKTTDLTLERLTRAGVSSDSNADGDMDTSAFGAIKRHMRKFSGSHVRALFATRQLAYSTSILMVLWGKPYRKYKCCVILLIAWLSSPYWSRIPLVSSMSTGVRVLIIQHCTDTMTSSHTSELSADFP
jgi:hypothetical protein